MGVPVKALALHGFLGLPNDWFGIVGEELSKIGLQIEPLDLWNCISQTVSDTDGFALSTAAAASRASAMFAETGVKPILMGYSMGGRLAMHAAVAHPDLFSGAVFISCHPGLTSEAERAQRLGSDQLWAERFRKQEWQSLMRDWNAQSVLAPPPVRETNFVELIREESKFNRYDLSCALDLWSLGRQGDLRDQLLELALPVLYVTGEHDRKYSDLASELRAARQAVSPHGQQHSVIPLAGHRVPWDAPSGFAQAVSRFAVNLPL